MAKTRPWQGHYKGKREDTAKTWQAHGKHTALARTFTTAKAKTRRRHAKQMAKRRRLQGRDKGTNMAWQRHGISMAQAFPQEIREIAETQTAEAEEGGRNNCWPHTTFAPRPRSPTKLPPARSPATLARLCCFSTCAPSHPKWRERGAQQPFLSWALRRPVRDIRHG